MFWPFIKQRMFGTPSIIMTDEFRSTLSIFEDSNDNWFLTGNAGTGKTTLVKLFRDRTKKKVVVLAPTGIAAFNAKGQTINSFFHFPPRIVTPQVIHGIRTNDRIFKTVDTIIIDEVSMVRADVFDGIDTLLRLKGRDSSKPFGGAQIILVGDPYQLPPVVTSDEEPIISKIYKTPYFFSAEAHKRGNFRLLELTEIHRQHDTEFIELLNLIRHGAADIQTLNPINGRFSELFDIRSKSKGITLTTTNKVADAINQTELLKLPIPEYEYKAKINGEFPEEKSTVVPRKLILRKGSRIMILKNAGKFYNGDMGTVTKLDEKSILVKLDRSSEELVVLREKWENIRYKIDSNSDRIVAEVIGVLEQFPLRLGWAITIHKSQGLTFDCINVDYTRSPFVSGQTYVALSRCRTLKGLTITKKLYPNDVFVDNRIVDYMNGMRKGTTINK